MSKNESVNRVTQTLDRNLSAGVEGDTVAVSKVDLAYSVAYVSELEREVERLNGRLEAVRAIMADPNAFYGEEITVKVLEAVRGE